MKSRFTSVAAIAVLCTCIVWLNDNLTRTEEPNRLPTSGIMMLAALPQRRIARGNPKVGLCSATVPVETAGFTLIELSIVLVIIGLIVGGILTGLDLINAAALRAQISQVEKYNTTVNTFQIKYGYLPGDIPNPYATQFGFASRGNTAGQGDGNGVIQGPASAYNPSTCIGVGEEGTFWVDLSTAGMLDGTFNTTNPTYEPTTDVTNSQMNLYLPQAKIGRGNYIYAWSGGTFYETLPGPPYYETVPYTTTGINYFGISIVSGLQAYTGWPTSSTPGMTVAQAYAIDKKIDDGFPLTGHVIALYVAGSDPQWLDGSDAMYSGPPTQQTLGSSTSCFDNNDIANAQEVYSMEHNQGSGLNCALSIQMQGAGR